MNAQPGSFVGQEPNKFVSDHYILTDLMTQLKAAGIPDPHDRPAFYHDHNQSTAGKGKSRWCMAWHRGELMAKRSIQGAWQSASTFTFKR
jgi:hypothetical protein